MNGLRKTACCTLLAVARMFAAGPAWGEGEVTVVGTAWQSPVVPEVISNNTSAQPVPQLQSAPLPDGQPPNTQPPNAQPPNGPAQPGWDDDGSEFSDEVAEFNNWLDGFGCGR
jgi:hypothetical protein